MGLQEELKTYKIGIGTVNKLSGNGMDTYYKNIEKTNYENLIYMFILFIILSLFLVTLLVLTDTPMFGFFIILGVVIISGVGMGIKLRFEYFFSKKEQKRIDEKYKNLFEIKKNIINFNSLIDELDALLESKEASKKMPNREDLLEILGLIRSDLLCSLKLDKVYRENPNYKGNRLIINDMSSEKDFSMIANQIHSKSSEMKDFINQLSDIRQSIRDIHNL